MKTQLKQKNDELKELLHENKRLKLLLNERIDNNEVYDLNKKIEEYEKLIQLYQNELETFKTTQDTARMEEVLKKTAFKKDTYVKRNKTLNNSKNLNSTNKLNKSFNENKIATNNNENLVKSFIIRENIRRDKLINSLKSISSKEYPSYENMKRLFNMLNEIFKTVHIGDMIEKAQNAQ